jgi:hypothetical protein
MTRLRHPVIVATLIAVGAMLLLLALSPSWAARSIAADLRKRIATADESSAASLVASLAALDAAGLPHLIELLDDPRPAVRQAARKTMSERLEVWSDQRTTTSQRNIEQLASLLVTHQVPTEFHSRAFVKLLALRLLGHSDDVSDANRVEFLANCSAILERTLSAATQESDAPRSDKSSDDPVVFEPGDSSHAAIPYEPFSPPTGDEAESGPRLTVSDSDEEGSQPPARIELHQPRRIDSPELNASSPQVDHAVLRALPTRSLIRRLHDAPMTAEYAEDELRRRGFDDQTLKVARCLDDADPKVRQQLAESLPGLSDLDPAPWLWELAEDEDENVRRTARNILATSSNPQTRARVGRLK